jgi:hypothetical protein
MACAQSRGLPIRKWLTLTYTLFEAVYSIFSKTLDPAHLQNSD